MWDAIKTDEGIQGCVGYVRVYALCAFTVDAYKDKPRSASHNHQKHRATVLTWVRAIPGP
jgi:hypothetical protein